MFLRNLGAEMWIFFVGMAITSALANTADSVFVSETRNVDEIDQLSISTNVRKSTFLLVIRLNILKSCSISPFTCVLPSEDEST